MRIVFRGRGRIHPYLRISWWGDPGTHSSSSSSGLLHLAFFFHGSPGSWKTRKLLRPWVSSSLWMLTCKLVAGNPPGRGSSAPDGVLRPLAKQLSASHPVLLVQHEAVFRAELWCLLDLYRTGNSTFGRGRGSEGFQHAPFFYTVGGNCEYDLTMKKLNVVLELTPVPFQLRWEGCFVQGFGEIWSGRAFANLLFCVEERRIKTGTAEEDGSHIDQGKVKAVLGEVKSLACLA